MSSATRANGICSLAISPAPRHGILSPGSFGYCLMSNHFHLLLKPAPGQSISRILPVPDRRSHLAAPPERGNQRPRLAGPLPIPGHPGRRPPARRSEVHQGQPGAGRDGGRSVRVYLVEPPLPMGSGMPIPSWTRSRHGSSSVALSRNVGAAGDGRSVGNNRPRSWLACGRRWGVGRPYGAEDWVEVISHRLGIVREPRRRGRPPREKML